MKRQLIRGAKVVSMARGRPAFEAADVLVGDDTIEAVDADLDVGDAEVIDAAGRIVIPGLVNAHLHTWQTALRSVGADWTLMEYLVTLRFSGASKFTADDVRVGTLAGAWNQINLGTTTLGDWSHNCATPEFTEAAVDALASTGIRALFMHGMPMWPGDAPHPADEFVRLARGTVSENPLLDIGLAVNGPQYSTRDAALADFELAAAHDCIISMHQSGGSPLDPGAWPAVFAAGLVGPLTNIVHGVGIPDEHLEGLVEARATFSLTPENELSQGHGLPIIRRLLDAGAAPSLGTDVECVAPGSVLDAARIALAHTRGMDNHQHQIATGAHLESTSVSSYEALEWATIRGAEALGMANRVGSLEPGKKADLVVIDATALNLWPPHDPVAAALQASLANIEAVMIGGVWRKLRGHLVGVDLDSLRDEILVSSRRLVTDIGLGSSVAS